MISNLIIAFIALGLVALISWAGANLPEANYKSDWEDEE